MTLAVGERMRKPRHGRDVARVPQLRSNDLTNSISSLRQRRVGLDAAHVHIRIWGLSLAPSARFYALNDGVRVACAQTVQDPKRLGLRHLISARVSPSGSIAEHGVRANAEPEQDSK